MINVGTKLSVAAGDDVALALAATVPLLARMRRDENRFFAEPHPDQKPLFRSDFTGAGRLPATKRTFNSKQMYSTTIRRYDDTTIRRYDDRSFFGEIGKIDHFLVNTRGLYTACPCSLRTRLVENAQVTWLGLVKNIMNSGARFPISN